MVLHFLKKISEMKFKEDIILSFFLFFKIILSFML